VKYDRPVEVEFPGMNRTDLLGQVADSADMFVGNILDPIFEFVFPERYFVTPRRSKRLVILLRGTRLYNSPVTWNSISCGAGGELTG
jgi:hypothetical protein